METSLGRIVGSGSLPVDPNTKRRRSAVSTAPSWQKPASRSHLFIILFFSRRAESDVQSPGQTDAGLREPGPHDGPRPLDVFVRELGRIARVVRVGPHQRERFPGPLLGVAG